MTANGRRTRHVRRTRIAAGANSLLIAPDSKRRQKDLHKHTFRGQVPFYQSFESEPKMKTKKDRIRADHKPPAAELIHIALPAKNQSNYWYRSFSLDRDLGGRNPDEFVKLSSVFELIEDPSRRSDQSGLLEGAINYQNKADGTKSCGKGDEISIWEFIEEFNDDPSSFDKVADVVRYSDDVVRYLHYKLEHYLVLMTALAKAGRGEAGRNMARYALRATDCIRELVKTNPEQFRAVAELELRWPVLRSPNPVMSQTDPDWERLGLGAVFPFRLHADKRLNVTDAAGQVAVKLWFYVYFLRKNTLQVLHQHSLTVADLKPECNKVYLYIQAARLPDFAPESMVVQKWFAAAQAALISAYPDPNDPAKLNTEIPQLNAMVKGDRDRATKGRLRHRISERLEKKFYWIAGLNPDHPVPPSG